MKRVFVKLVDDSVHLVAGDRFEYDNEYLKIYNGNEIVGLFDLAVINCAYISVSKG